MSANTEKNTELIVIFKVGINEHVTSWFRNCKKEKVQSAITDMLQETRHIVNRKKTVKIAFFPMRNASLKIACR